MKINSENGIVTFVLLYYVKANSRVLPTFGRRDDQLLYIFRREKLLIYFFVQIFHKHFFSCRKSYNSRVLNLKGLGPSIEVLTL